MAHKRISSVPLKDLVSEAKRSWAIMAYRDDGRKKGSGNTFLDATQINQCFSKQNLTSTTAGSNDWRDLAFDGSVGAITCDLPFIRDAAHAAMKFNIEAISEKDY